MAGVLLKILIKEPLIKVNEDYPNCPLTNLFVRMRQSRDADAGVTPQRSASQTRPQRISNMIDLREIRQYYN
jgi:hypothetical protein